MKNVTITLEEAVASRARIAAATQGKSLSRFISELVERAVAGQSRTQLEVLEEFFSGSGVAGISKNWRGREALYGEREDELLRRYEHHRVRGRSRRAGKAAVGLGFAEGDDPEPGPRSKRTKPE
jgi:hypothetical protein